ncbi:poly(U)-specific endoribonuclease-B-like isoform X2 [Ananas comosus]|uniref:Poly(U)-specific endoribonuclease-B-like isoform X2 n=1 Tax=Ananas comosus TaxID=4615 RepID=A0A6P5FGW7_ANACO|nr:poly(U)-specific endoribonuclease-B-like isoform X2 [Ananas comosus]
MEATKLPRGEPKLVLPPPRTRSFDPDPHGPRSSQAVNRRRTRGRSRGAATAMAGERVLQEESAGGSEGVWESFEAKKKPQHHASSPVKHYQGEGKERKDGDWETVEGKKKPHHPPLRRQHQSEAWQGYKQPPSEQVYSDDTTHRINIETTDQELDNLSRACHKLWELDTNRLVPGKDYEINCGEGKKVYQKDDMAANNLFTWLDEDILRRPTYSRFCSLLDNYNPNEGVKEVITSEEKHEQEAFIEEISRTAPMKYLHKYLVAKRVVPHDFEEFKNLMKSLWFHLYGRGGGSSCSSAFEHVFVGEIKGRGEHEVSGFHNWIQFYLEEAKGTVNYQGYIFPRRRGQIPDTETQLLTIQFEWHGILKSVSTSLIGVSPEFEIALYTLCFFVGGEDNHVQLGPYSVNIKCYRLGNNKIGSIFPIAED